MEATPADARPVREALGAFAVVTVLTVVISRLGELPLLSEYVHLAVGLLFLGVAVQLAGRLPGGLSRYGLQLGGLLDPPEARPSGMLESTRDLLAALRRGVPLAARELLVALALAAVIFPPFAWGFSFWHAPARPFELGWPPELPSYVLSQILVVALPEEAFFRGYLQTRLGDGGTRRIRVLGASISPFTLLLTSTLFALIHFAVDLHPARLAVFFPALLFGWVRELRGGIGAAVFLHALSNLLSDVLVRSWL